MDCKGKTKMRESGKMDYEGKTKKRKLGTAKNARLASAIGGEYDVFLSFTGKDTRKGFTDFLYNYLVDAGIRTFRDDNELRVGEEIGPELLQAIKESKISIPIFSHNYASSKWCLLELAQMVECRRSTEQKIKPIFYDVEPGDVKHQTGSYEEAFRQHEKRFDMETVQRWKEALKEVGGLKGWELQKETNGHQGKLVKLVVLEVLSQLKKNYMAVTNNSVGIDHHIEEMERLLNVDSNDVRIVGIYGMGGLGKTTIAKFVYNKLYEFFDCCCFLADVREKSQQCNGLVELQKLLISKIRKGKSPDIPTVDEGMNMIKGMACEKKVLIVLDDVDEESQFAKLVGKRDWFGSGSRIIVTTRNKGVLNVFEVYEEYEPCMMEFNHAVQLFSKHAFRSDFPPKDYDSLSKEIVSTTGGLPLALEIIGSVLFGKCEEIWDMTLDKLKDKPADQVQKQLRISYDALNNEEKQIFLDIACFFNGENKTLPFYMWEDCKYYPACGINILVLKSLVKIGDDNEFRMHHQLRDLGREIVYQENIKNPGKRSRLWRYDNALEILKDRTGTKKVEALCLQEYSEEHSFTNDEFGKKLNVYNEFIKHDQPRDLGREIVLQESIEDPRECSRLWIDEEALDILDRQMGTEKVETLCLQEHSEVHSFTNDQFEKLSELRFFRVNRTVLKGDFKNLLSKLRWLQWHMCTDNSKPINFHLKNLVILDLRHSWITESWEGWSQIMRAEKLKVLRLSHCRGLTITPDLSNLVMLKILDLHKCSKLVEFRGLTGLKSLEILDMSWCTSLKRLPDLSNLVKLKRLYLSACNNLDEFGSLTGLKSLEILDMSYYTSLKRLPDLSNLKNLKKLKIRGWKNLTEIRELEELESLTLLDITGCEAIEKGDLSERFRAKFGLD